MEHWFKALVVAAACMVGGCATNQTAVDGRMTLPAQIAANDGVVLLKVVGVQPLGAFNAKWGSLRLQDKSTGRVEELQDTAPAPAGFSLFMGSLPAGEYEIVGLNASGAGVAAFGLIPALVIMAATSDNQELQSKLSGFTVKAGQMTNLGSLVTSIPEAKGQSMKIAVLGGEAGRASALDSVQPQAKQRLVGMPASIWMAGVQDRVEDAQAIVREHARPTAAPVLARDGRVLLGTAAGMIHARSSTGAWSSMSVGSMDTIRYVRTLDDGRIVAGGDGGAYFLNDGKSGGWTRHALVHPEAQLVNVEPAGPHGFIVATVTTTQRRRTFQAHLKKSLEGTGTGEELLAFEGISAGNWLPVMYADGQLHVWFNHIGFARTADHHTVDLRTLQKNMDKTASWVVATYKLLSGRVMMHRMNGATLYGSFSDDDGRTWSHDNDRALPGSSLFLSDMQAIGLVTKTTGWSTVTQGIRRSADGGKSWKDLGTPIEIDGAASLLVAPESLYVLTGSRLMSSTDEGQTWKVEWPQARGPVAAQKREGN